jgi:aconitate hydratase
MSKKSNLHFDPTDRLNVGDENFNIFRLDSLEKEGLCTLDILPRSIRILLENLLRNAALGRGSFDELQSLVCWSSDLVDPSVIPFMPGRVVLQDFTGVPALVDLAAMRSAMARGGGDPGRINPQVPADLVIDHSVQVDRFGTADSYEYNVMKEIERNRERYSLLKWGQSTFENFRVVPPGTGIVHQVNLEYLGQVVSRAQAGGEVVAFPDTLVGTDSHTPMINGLGVLGWGVGGIEAEAVLLGQPYYMLIPEVVGVKVSGELLPGVTATDLVLTVTRILRKRGVVGKFVEFFGPGIAALTLPDRATISNMSPEFGATATLFPVDEETLRYLTETGRPPALVRLVENYMKEQGLFHGPEATSPVYTDIVEVDLGKVETSLAGPRKPHERVSLSELKSSFLKSLPDMLEMGVVTDPGSFADSGCWTEEGGAVEDAPDQCLLPVEPRVVCRCVPCDCGPEIIDLCDGSVVIAAITSCTNTSNPAVMIGAGLLARNAVQKGLRRKPWVKTSLAPGSKVVSDYLELAGLMPYLEALGFHVVGYGCTTCIGNSGPLPSNIASTIEDNQLVTAAVLSGNRNYEARINPYVRANYLASPMLVVAYALAGTVEVDLSSEPIGSDPNDTEVYLADIWPAREEIDQLIAETVHADLFEEECANVFTGGEEWNKLKAPGGNLYEWDPESSYIREPPFFMDLSPVPPPWTDISGARILAIFGDTLTTDHISPAGNIPEDGPAGKYLVGQGINVEDFNSFGSRRGNHEVMLRGTFANIRIRNRMVDEEGGWTLHQPTGDRLSVYEAASRYREDGVPLVILGGEEYGAGSSRDWAAKGAHLLGVKAVIARSYERIHRSNLVGMGVLPLQFVEGQSADSLGLTGAEVINITGIGNGLEPHGTLKVIVAAEGSEPVSFDVLVRLDSVVDVEYYRNGGILQTVLRQMMRGNV